MKVLVLTQKDTDTLPVLKERKVFHFPFPLCSYLIAQVNPQSGLSVRRDSGEGLLHLICVEEKEVMAHAGDATAVVRQKAGGSGNCT